MFVCTIAAEAGTGGDSVAATIAARSGARLLDRPGLISLAHELDPAFDDLDDVEQRGAGRLPAIGIGLALTTGTPEAFREFELRKSLGQLGRFVLGEAAREPAVI